MGVAGIPWTEEECDFIDKNINSMTILQMSEHLNRSYNSVKAKVKRERSRMESGRGKIILWSKDDDDFLIKNYKTMTSKELGDKLGKNARAVQSRLNKLYKKNVITVGRNNYKLWTKEEEDTLKKMFYKDYELSDIADHLNKKIDNVYSKIIRMGLLEYKDNTRLSQEDKEYIIEQSKNFSSNAISKKLKKSKVAVEREIRKNRKGWSNSFSDKRWTQEQIDYLEIYWGDKPCEAMAKHLKRSRSAIRAKARKLGFDGMFLTSVTPTLRTIMVSFGIEASYTHFKKKIIDSGLELIIMDTTACVNMKVFWKWLKENSDIFSFDKYDGSLCPEPEWFLKKVKEDIEKRKKYSKNKTIWNNKDINLLVSLYKLKKYSNEEIGKRLGRTECAIKCMIKKLKKEGRLK